MLKPMRDMTSVMIGVGVSSLAIGVVLPIIPDLCGKGSNSLAILGILMSVNKATRVIFNPAIGAAVDRFGIRRIFLAGLWLQFAMTACYFGAAVSHNPIPLMMIGRLIQGPATGCVFVAGQTHALADGDSVGSGYKAGWIRSAIMTGMPLGLVLGGMSYELFGAVGTFGVLGGGFAAALIANVVAAKSDGFQPRSPAVSVPTLAQAGNKPIALLCAIGFAASFAVHGVMMTTLGVEIFDRHFSLFGLGSAGTTSIILSISIVSMVVGSPALGAFGDRNDKHGTTLLAGSGLVLLSMLIFSFPANVVLLSTASGMAGLGASAVVPSLLALASRNSNEGEKGKWVGLMQFSGDLGSMIGSLLAAYLLSFKAEFAYFAASAVVVLAMLPAGFLCLHSKPSMEVGLYGK